MASNTVHVSTPPTDRLALTLCGEMHLLDRAGNSLPVTGRRERVLLAFLALTAENRETRRNLINFLWGDKADDTTLDNLRTCLWSLRKALGEANQDIVVADREWIGLDPQAIDVDLWRAERLSTSDVVADLQIAAEILSGEFLEGLDIESDSFATWVRDQRSRCMELRIATLGRLADAHRVNGEIEAALAAAQDVLRIDPFNEPALRQLMSLYVASGRRNTALQAYLRFAEDLDRELAVEPEPETQAAYRELLHLSDGDTAVSPPPEGSSAVEAPSDSPEEPEEEVTPPRSGPGPRFWLSRSALRIPLWAFGGAATVGVLALIVTGIIFWRVPVLAPPMVSNWISGIKTELEGAPPSVAVLPFRGRGDREADGYAAAISDVISAALSQTSNMLVISRSSSEHYKANPPPAPEIARQLGVRYLLEGRLAKFGDSVTVQVGLIDTFEGEKTIPIGTYQRQTGDFFTLQSDVTLKVVTALRVRLTEGEEERIRQDHGTKDFNAWLHASEGQKNLRLLTRAANHQARRNYQAALAADPNYAGAWTGLAWTYLIDSRFGWGEDRMKALEKSAELAKKSLALDDKRAATYALLGSVALFAGRFDAALRMGERSVELEYNDADSLALYALTLTYTGQPRKAKNLIERAIRLRPYPPRWYRWLLARTYRLIGRPGRAVEILTSGTGTTGRSVLPLVELALAYSDMGALLQARETAKTVLKIYPRFSVKAWLAVPAYQDQTDTERDLAVLRTVGLPD